MSKITFDLNNAMAHMVSHGFTESELKSPLLDKAHKAIEAKQLGFRKLPSSMKEIVDDINETADKVRKNYESFVVLGIGGSALGPIAVYQALGMSRDKVDFKVLDNVDPEALKRAFEDLNIEKTMFNVVTKSGKTSETMAQFMVAADLIRSKGLKLSDHIIATTDKENGNLALIAKQESLKTFVIPADVGGRFSELSPVGLLPAAVCGFDIKKMLEGASYMDDICSGKDKNPAAMFALLHVLGMKKGMNISVMLPYADSLKYISDWYAQLWAESLGKRVDTQGNEVFVGQTPVKALGATDQHSQVQLYVEGPFDKITTFLKVEKFREELKIPTAFEYVDDISFLAGKTFGELINAECTATQYALTVAGRPNIEICLSEVDEFSVGALLYFFEMAVSFTGEMLGINTFDQPGVEQGKLATFALMGKKGFEQYKTKMSELPDKLDAYKF